MNRRFLLTILLTLLLTAACTHPIPEAFAPRPITARTAPADSGLHADPIETADDARRFYLLQRVGANGVELPGDVYAAARQRIAAMPRIPIASSVPGSVRRSNAAPRFSATTSGWTSLGPGNIGGRTRAIVIHPQDPNIMYAASVTGGVWKTTDGGQSWVPQFDSQAVLNIGTLVMDPTNPNVLYAGTGEYYTAYPGNGIYKTTNGGATWAPLAATANTQFTYVNKIAISPNNNQRIYAATWGGIWTSGNGGTSWSNILSTKTAFFGCQDVAVRPDMNPDVVFTSCSGATNTGDYQILQSVNGPAGNFVQVHTQPDMGRISLAIAPSQPATIYALATDNNTASPYYHGLLGVYRSTSGGGAGTWTTQVSNTDPNITNTLLLTDARTVIGNFCNNAGPITPSAGQGNYDNVIAVDPLNPNVVWAGGVEVFRSDDGGANWGVASLCASGLPEIRNLPMPIVMCFSFTRTMTAPGIRRCFSAPMAASSALITRAPRSLQAARARVSITSQPIA